MELKKMNGMEPIYFSKVEFRKRILPYESVILLDLASHELSFQVMKSGYCSSEAVFSYGIFLSQGWMNQILPLCNALDFVSYSGDAVDDWGLSESWLCIRDDAVIEFQGITDSYIPLQKVTLLCLDENPIHPAEKLYQFLLKNILSGNSEIRPWL